MTDDIQPDAAPPAPAGPAPAPQVPRSVRREKAACDALRTLVRDFQMDRFGLVPDHGADLALTLRLKVKPSDGWSLTFDPPLIDQITPQIEDAQADQNAFQPGRVYCFRCDSAQCEHAAPPSALAVFSGYGATGLPEWQDFPQTLVEERDERVDRLFEDHPPVLAHFQLGHALRQRQLSSFGRASKTYAVLGQVVAGYFILPHRRGEAGGPEADRRLAMTFQIVETRGPDRGLRLRLNVLAHLPDGLDLEEFLVSDRASWVYRARELAERALDQAEQRVRAARDGGKPDGAQAALQGVPLILRRLAENLERGARQGQRRTRHVEDRRQERRPVHKALEDAQAAATQAIYYDERHRTLITCGPQGRAHVFNENGRHVTSFVLGPGAIALRMRTQRWRPATAVEAEALKHRVKGGGAPPAA